MTVFSRDGVVVDVRGSVAKMVGYEPEDFVGRPVLDFAAPSAVAFSKRALREGLTGAFETTMRDREGNLVPVEIIAVNSTLDGKPTRVSGLRDLRERKREQEQRRRLERQLERAQRLDSLGVLAGGIAHDFNNLLVGIIGNTDLLLGEVTDPETRELLQAIASAGESAARLTAQMLAYAGRGELGVQEPIDVGERITQLTVLLAAGLSKKARLEVQAEPECKVLGDQATLSQLLMNLLTNASDALGDARGEIDVRVRRETQPDARWDEALGATVGPGEWVLVEVRDSGQGMDEATTARIFEPFFTTKPTGHGLGLAASLGIVSAMGGAVLVETELGKGSCFSLLLPRTEGSAPALPTTREDPRITPCKVLVVDDEAVVRAQMRRSLELRGYTVFEANDGRAGLTARRQHLPDVLVLDATMPDLDGAQVIEALRSEGSNVPVVLTSGYLDEAMQERLEPGSFQAFLRKPYVIRELVEAIEGARRAP